MNFIQQIGQGLQRVWDAIARIFSPSSDDYPESGTQPYEGKLPEESR